MNFSQATPPFFVQTIALPVYMFLSLFPAKRKICFAVFLCDLDFFISELAFSGIVKSAFVSESGIVRGKPAYGRNENDFRGQRI